MTGKEIYRIWAPTNSKWSGWVRPVPFIAIDKKLEINEFIDFSLPNIYYINEYSKETAIIIDLPSYKSIEEGISLTKIGYRPIPIFNGTIEEPKVMSTTNNHIIVPALVWGGNELKNIKLSENANPVFLLDTERLNRRKMNPSVFDNSWDIYDQDVPSANYFLNNGITKIIIRSDKIHKDLKKILYNYQKKNIEIYFTNGYEEVKKVIIKKPTKKELKEN